MGGLHIALELQHRQVLEDTLLDAVEAIVLAVKDLLCALEVEVILTEDPPKAARGSCVDTASGSRSRGSAD